jgi:hypothetical protein
VTAAATLKPRVLELRDGVPTYLAQPQGAAPVAFQAPRKLEVLPDRSDEQKKRLAAWLGAGAS